MSVLAKVRFDSETRQVFVNDQLISCVKAIDSRTAVDEVPQVTLTLNGSYDIDQIVALDVELDLGTADEILKGLRLMTELDEEFRADLLARIGRGLREGAYSGFTERAEVVLMSLTEEQ